MGMQSGQVQASPSAMKGTQNAGGSTASMKGANASQNGMAGTNPQSGGIQTGTYTQQNQGLYTGSPQGQGFQGQGQGFNGAQGMYGVGSSFGNPSNPALGGGMQGGPVAQPSYLFQPQTIGAPPAGVSNAPSAGLSGGNMIRGG